MKSICNSLFFTGFPVITKLPWDPIILPPIPNPTSEEEEHVVAAGGEKGKEEKDEIIPSEDKDNNNSNNNNNNNNNNKKGKEKEMIPPPPPPPINAGGERKRERDIYIKGSSSSTTPPPIKKLFLGGTSDVTTTGEEEDNKKEETSFTGFPVITKLPWELPPQKYEPSLEGIEIPKLAGWPEDGQVIYVDKTTGREDIYHRNYDPTTNWPRMKSFPWWPVPPTLDVTSVVTIFDPAGNKIPTPYIKQQDNTIVQIDPNDYTYTCKPEIPDHHRYSAQPEDSQGFDVDPIPGVVPMDHLGAEKKQCELVARMAVDEYNRRYNVIKEVVRSLTWKGVKGEIKFSKIIKVMVKAVSGFIYYITAEAISLSSEKPVTFQAVVFTSVSENEVISFRFMSDSKKVPWLWKEYDICTRWQDV